MNNVSIRLIFDRKNVATKKNQASVQIEVSYQRKRKYIGTGVRLYADQWGKDSKMKNHPQAIQLYKQITDQVSEMLLNFLKYKIEERFSSYMWQGWINGYVFHPKSYQVSFILKE